MAKNRGQLVVGLVLILAGAWYIAQYQIPAFNDWAQQYLAWPLNMVAGGAALLLLGLLLGAPGMAVPAAIVAGIGGIFYYQQMRELGPDSWSYLWPLIIGSIGVGTTLAGILGRDGGQVRGGLNTLAVSAVLFVVFASVFGQLTILGAYGPAILLILLGVWLMARGWFRGRKGGEG